jgi:RNA polymerase sigma factor (sigma-70 family)
VEAGGVGDGALWQRSQDGDGEAFGLLFDRHRDRVFRHACRLVESHHDAEDVTAAVFLELWRRRAVVRLIQDSVLPWLLVTTTNVGRNARRATRRYRSFIARLPRESSAPDAADVALDEHALGVNDDLRTALAALGKQDLQLFSLVVLEDCSVRDAAVVLGLTPAAAKSRLHRARHRIRADLVGTTGTAEQIAVRGGDA